MTARKTLSLEFHGRATETANENTTPPDSGLKYEDLDGGIGREVHFRPHRYPSSELGPVGAVVAVVLDGEPLICELHDVSQNGVAFEWRGEPLAVGASIPLLTVSFDRHEAYRGAACVGSVRQLGEKQIVGASFLDTLMNTDDVLQLRDVKAWRGRGPGLTLRDLPWRFEGHERFKSLVGEFRLLCQDAVQQLGELEGSLPWHVVHADQDLPARDALIERVRIEVVDEILAVYNAIGSLQEPVTPSQRQAMKEYSLRHLHEFFMQSPWVRRAREKPLGYPGDYELMNGIYGNGVYGGFSGSTLFAKAFNVMATQTPSSVAVVERKNLVKKRLSELLDVPPPAGRPIRILSLAAGPAQETYELLQERETVPYPVEIVLFDQDKRALAFAYGRLKRLVAERWSGQVSIVYVHDTIKRLLRDPRLFASSGEFDTIFCCGLFDYLPQVKAAALTTTLFASLARGGALCIGNQTPRTTSRWAIEFHCDWYLIYREPAEMIEFAKAGAPTASVAIEEEPTGVNPFVILTRDRDA